MHGSQDAGDAGADNPFDLVFIAVKLIIFDLLFSVVKNVVLRFFVAQHTGNT